MRIVIASVLVLAVAACSPKPAEAPQATAPAAPNFAYDIALSFTPAAAEKVAKRGDKVTISALYYGNPTTAAASEALEDAKDGTIHLNTDLLEVDAKDQTVHMTGAGAQVPNLQMIVEKKPLVLLNIFATKAGRKDPIIGCGVFQDYVANAQPKPIAIACDVK